MIFDLCHFIVNTMNKGSYLYWLSLHEFGEGLPDCLTDVKDKYLWNTFKTSLLTPFSGTEVTL